jgi:hypothetical protein
MRQTMKEIGNDPVKAMNNLIELGIYEKSGKRLAKPYRCPTDDKPTPRRSSSATTGVTARS